MEVVVAMSTAAIRPGIHPTVEGGTVTLKACEGVGTQAIRINKRNTTAEAGTIREEVPQIGMLHRLHHNKPISTGITMQTMALATVIITEMGGMTAEIKVIIKTRVGTRMAATTIITMVTVVGQIVATMKTIAQGRITKTIGEAMAIKMLGIGIMTKIITKETMDGMATVKPEITIIIKVTRTTTITPETIGTIQTLERRKAKFPLARHGTQPEQIKGTTVKQEQQRIQRGEPLIQQSPEVMDHLREELKQHQVVCRSKLQLMLHINPARRPQARSAEKRRTPLTRSRRRSQLQVLGQSFIRLLPIRDQRITQAILL